LFKRGVRQYKVIAELERDEPADLGGIHLRSAGGAMVPLSNFVRWEEQSAPSTRYHYDRAPLARISANLDGITVGEAIARACTLAETLRDGFRTALDGQAKDFEEGSSSVLQMFLLALAPVYLLLAAQFDSFVAPVSIMTGSARSALGIAVGGGMIFATVLTLYVMPVVYATLASIGRVAGDAKGRG